MLIWYTNPTFFWSSLPASVVKCVFTRSRSWADLRLDPSLTFPPPDAIAPSIHSTQNPKLYFLFPVSWFLILVFLRLWGGRSWAKRKFAAASNSSRIARKAVSMIPCAATLSLTSRCMYVYVCMHDVCVCMWVYVFTLVLSLSFFLLSFFLS